MRYRLMATYRGASYEAGVGPTDKDVTLFAACPPPEELGFEPAAGHWRKAVSRAEVDAVWESLPAGMFGGEPCLVLDDLGEHLHISYLGQDLARAGQLGYSEVEPGVFEQLATREDVTDITEDRVDHAFLPWQESWPGGVTGGAANSHRPVATPAPPIAYPVPGSGPAATDPEASSGPAATDAAPAPNPAVTDTAPAPGPAATNAALPPGPAATNPPLAPGPAATNAVPAPGPAATDPALQRGPAATDAAPPPGSAATEAAPAPGLAVTNPVSAPKSTITEPGPGPDPAPTEPGPGPGAAPTSPGPGSGAALTSPGPGPGAAVTNLGPGADAALTGPGPVPDPGITDAGPAGGLGRRHRRAARQPRAQTRQVFAELAGLAALPRDSYAVDEAVDGAICLVSTDTGFEVFSAADGVKREARLFNDEEAAYFYLFGLLAAEAVRDGRLAPPGA